MSLAIVYSRTVCGMSAPLITVEVHLSNGLPQFNIVGLPKAALKESKDRVRSALIHTHFLFPSKRITINLAPTDLPKEGAGLDLAIALGVLTASQQIAVPDLIAYEFVGELALSGDLRPVKTILPIILAMQDQPKRQLIIPKENAIEASLAQQKRIFYANHLLDVLTHLKGETALPTCPYSESLTLLSSHKQDDSIDLAHVKGQLHAKHALEIAAAGGHSLLLIGSPGTGKTMLAHCLPTILPPLTHTASLEVAAITSMTRQGFDPTHWGKVPFRAPHHSASSAALIGGGRPPQPGEVSLSHHGILFLDELPEFSHAALESLREPLELGMVAISRVAFQITFPAKFQLIAAMNPCPCGYAGHPHKSCGCSFEQIRRYRNKISGPLLDRIDMHVEMSPITAEMLTSFKHLPAIESSQEIRQRIISARTYQQTRQNKSNAALSLLELEKIAILTPKAEHLLNQVIDTLKLSVRSYHRILKLARTIADLNTHPIIEQSHLSAVLPYRCLDRGL